MNALELKLARRMAEDQSIDLSNVDDSVLFGFGCPDFQPVEVSIKAIAKCMRWQCCTFAGGWDEKQWNEDRQHWLRRRDGVHVVSMAEVSDAEARLFLRDQLLACLTS